MAGGGSWISAAEQRRAPPFSRLKAVNHLARGDYSEGLSGLRAQHAKKIMLLMLYSSRPGRGISARVCET